MKRVQRFRLSTNVLLILALGALVFQLVAFSDVGHAVAKQVQDVFITNTESNPVPVDVQGTTLVRTTDEGTVELVHEERFIAFGLGSTRCSSAQPIAVPAGKRLIITDVSFNVAMPQGQTLLSVSLVDSSLVQPVVTIPVTPAGGTTNEPPFVFTGFEQLHLLVDSDVFVCGERDSTIGTVPSARVTVNGYVVDRQVP